MSTILKALKKLDEEKRAAAPLPLSGKILADQGGSRRRPRHLPLVAAGAMGGLLFAALAVAAFLWLTGSPPVTPEKAGMISAEPPDRAVSSSLPASSAATNPVLAPVATPVSVPPPKTSTAVSSVQPVKGREPVVPVAEPPRPAPQPPAAAAAAAAAASAATPTTTAAESRPEPATPRQVNSTAPQIPPPGQQWTAPHLVVTEIFPGAGNGGWMALVNGLPVMEGTRVEDALVKEIRAGEVLFESAGRIVVVPVQAAD